MTNEQVIKILQTYSDIFNLDTILGRTMRELLWGIVKVLGYLVNSISAITDKLFVLDKFYNNPKVIDFINSVKPLIVVLFALSLLGIGYQLMFSQTKQFRKIGTNILVAIAVILVLPMAMDKMNALTNLGVSTVKGAPPDLTNQIIKSNVTDVLLYDKLNFNKDDISGLKNPNSIDVNNIIYIDPTSTLEPDFINTSNIKNKDVFGDKLATNVDGNLTIEKLNQGWMTFWKEYYYRFNINFLNIIVSLGVVGATLAFTCFKLAKLMFELAYNKFLAILIAPADINDGQKTKAIIQNIMSIFVVVFLIAVLLKFYVLFVGMCAGVQGIEGVILLVAGSFAVIDGPNIVEKLFGIDAGLHSGFKTMAGAFMVGSAIMGGTGKLGSTAKGMADGVGKVAGSVFGAGAGIANGLNNKKHDSLYKDMAKDKQKKSDDANKGESLYKDMARDKAKENESPIKSSTANPSKENGTSNPEGNIKGNGSHKSIYDEMKDSNKKGSGGGNMYTENPPSKSLYEEMGQKNEEPINSSNGGETSSNEGNEVSGHITPDNTPEPIQSAPSSGNETSGHVKTEPIQHNNRNVSHQTIGQHQKQVIIEKVQNNPIVKQTRESYNRGKNTGQNIRNRNK